MWAPSFVVGGAGGTSAAVAVALLLYSGEGMLRSLTMIIAVELVALGVGLAGPLEGVLAAFQYCTHVAIENCTLGALT